MLDKIFFENQFVLIGTYSALTIAIDSKTQMLRDLFCLFCDVKIDEKNALVTFRIKNEYRMNSELRGEISKFIKTNICTCPQLQYLGRWLRLVEDGDMFYFLPRPQKPELMEKLKEQLLRENLKGFIDNESSVKLIKSSIEEKYEIRIFDEKTLPIGESDKSKRKCIFCDCDNPANYKQKAHAISESLGNKNLVQNEECDSCNNFFGSDIEAEFAKFLAFFRCMFKVKGKNGVPQKEGHFGVSDNEFTFNGSIWTQTDNTLSIVSDVPEKIVPQKLYKALVKFAISLIGNGFRDELVDTISWLKGGWADENELPKIALSCQHPLAKDHPWAICYIRKNENQSLPKFVLEFHFLFFVFVVIIPYVKDETTNFALDENYKQFWEKFPHFKQSSGWIFESWSLNEEQEFKNVLTFVRH